MNKVSIGMNCDCENEANIVDSSRHASPPTVILKPKSATNNPYYLSQMAAAHSRHRRHIVEGKEQVFAQRAMSNAFNNNDHNIAEFFNLYSKCSRPISS